MKLIIYTHTNTETNKIELEPYDLMVVQLNEGDCIGKGDLDEIFKWICDDDRLTTPEIWYEIEGDWDRYLRETTFDIENVKPFVVHLKKDF